MDSTTTFRLFDDTFMTPLQKIYAILLIILLPALIAKYIQWKQSRKHMYKLAATVPHPPVSKLPLIGHAHHFIGGTTNVFKSFSKMFQSKTPTTIWLGPKLLYLISNPRDLEIILNSQDCLGKNDFYRFLDKFVKNCVFTAPVPIWKKTRKMMNPGFNKIVLNKHVDIYTEQAEIFANLLEIHDSYFNIGKMCINFTMDCLGETLIGEKLHSQTTDANFSNILETSLEILMRRMFNIAYYNDQLFNMLPAGKKMQQIYKEVHGNMEKIVQNKQNEYKTKQQNKLLEAEIGENDEKTTILDLLIELQHNGADISNMSLKNNSIIQLVAGSDTSATTLAFAIVLLGMFPQYQQKVYEEVIDVIGTSRTVEYTDLPKLTYTGQFIKETMRIFPAAPLFGRTTEEDIKLSNCVVPKGVGLLLGIIYLHRDPEIYPDPLKFDPERFNAKEIAKRHPYSFLPFSQGPRNCIGFQQGMMMMKTLVATLIQRFSFETTFKNIEDIEIKQSVVLRSVKGFPVKVTKRAN